MVKAIILSGGFGTRLRPLTCARPKSLFPIVNTPLMETQIVNLARAGITEVILAINYMKEVVQAYFGDGSKFGIKVTYSEEIEPLGTAGAVKNAERYIDGDTFFVLNGDIVSTIDYAEIIQFHQIHAADLTLAGYFVDDPSRYGVMHIDEENRVLEFIEKPKHVKKKDITQLPINAGVSLFEPSVLDLIPPGQKVSMEREIYPQLVEGGRVFCMPFSGIWLDVGLPADFMQANKLLLDYTNLENQNQPVISDDCHLGENVVIERPVAIDAGATIGSNCQIGPFVSIGKNAKIGDGVHISNAVLMDNVRIGSYSSIKEVILGTGVNVGQWVKMEGSNSGLVILADHVFVQSNITLLAWGTNVSRCPWEEIKESIFPNV